MLDSVRSGFFKYGWLLPLLTPAAQVGGRALVNILLLVYLIWAAVALPGSGVRWRHPALLFFMAVLVAYALSVPSASYTDEAVHQWVKFALHMLVFPITLAVLQSRADARARLVAALGQAGLLLLALLFLVLPFQMVQASFEPTTVLLEDNLPFLLPFMFHYIVGIATSRWRFGVGITVVGLSFAYILLSQGRAALAGLLVALLVYGVLMMQRHVIPVIAVTVLVSVLGVLASYDSFFRTAQGGQELTAWLDDFTSQRTRLWRQALVSPPDSPWTGVGMGNVSMYSDVVVINSEVKLGHLHNFLLDAWYETGIIGLVSLLAFIVAPLMRGIAVIRRGGDSGRIASVCLASVAALLVAALLSFSYASRQFALYLPILLAVLWTLSRPRTSD